MALRNLSERGSPSRLASRSLVGPPVCVRRVDHPAALRYCPTHLGGGIPVADEETSRGSFEDALTELERIVEQMESGELSLEESLAAFERGVKLTRECQQALSKAEQKVSALIEHNGEATLTDFHAGDDEDDLEP